MDYVLARKQVDGLLFFCDDDPGSLKTCMSLDRAKQFPSPGDALECRSKMEPRWQQKFIVHEVNGDLLHSLDV
jgi:hypothetical protein